MRIVSNSIGGVKIKDITTINPYLITPATNGASFFEGNLQMYFQEVYRIYHFQGGQDTVSVWVGPYREYEIIL